MTNKKYKQLMIMKIVPNLMNRDCHEKKYCKIIACMLAWNRRESGADGLDVE